jgi:carbon monoxide dehydrogenase subunit G
MKIENEFTVSVPIEQAWAVLTDLAGVAPCMPGAQLTGVDGDVYSGKVKIKVGPVVSEYAGTVRFVEKDEASYRAVIDAKGRDSRGAGNASAAVTAQLRDDGARTVVNVDTELKISGKIAQFGSGMIKEVSAKLLGQFVACLEAKLLVTADQPTDQPTEQPTDTVPQVVRPADVPGGTDAEDTGGVQVSAAAVEPEPLDVMGLAGGSIYKRVIPVAVVLAVIVIIVGYLLVR